MTTGPVRAIVIVESTQNTCRKIAENHVTYAVVVVVVAAAAAAAAAAVSMEILGAFILLNYHKVLTMTWGNYM